MRINEIFYIDPVACITQTGNDVAVLVQVVVHRTAVDIHIGMSLLQKDATRERQPFSCALPAATSSVRSATPTTPDPWR